MTHVHNFNTFLSFRMTFDKPSHVHNYVVCIDGVIYGFKYNEGVGNIGYRNPILRQIPPPQPFTVTNTWHMWRNLILIGK